jgi:hypothetical protein
MLCSSYTHTVDEDWHPMDLANIGYGQFRLLLAHCLEYTSVTESA